MAKRKDTKDLEQDAERTEIESSDDGDSSEGAEVAKGGAASDGDSSADDSSGDDSDDDAAPTEIGTVRYVHAAFIGAGILAAYLCGKLLLTAWNMLSDWPDAVKQLPVLIQYGEDERANFTMVAGALLGIAIVLGYYRKESVRSWAGEVASELSRVTWPNKETVTNGTMVVLVATLVATVYVAILDRFWGYLTNLVYGA